MESNNKGIWGTGNCERCGACCYIPFVILSNGEFKEGYTLCPNLEINGLSKCTSYESRPEMCKTFFCNCLDNKRLEEHFRDIAINFLKTL